MRTDGSKGATGVKSIPLHYFSTSPNGVGDYEPITQKQFDLFVAGKPSGTWSIMDLADFLLAKDSYFTGRLTNGNKEFVIEFQTDDNSVIKLKMAGNQVWTNIYASPAANFYIVAGAIADPGLVRPGLKDVAGFSNAKLIQDKLAGDNSHILEVDATGHPNDPNYALIVISK